MIDPKLQTILDSKKTIAKAMLQHLFENDNFFNENLIKRLKHLLAERRARVGYDMKAGESGAWIWDDSELDEGIGSALMHLVRSTVARTAASGLGVSPGTINTFTKHLINRPKQVAFKTAMQKPATAGAKPVHTKPAASRPAGASLHTNPIHHAVLPSDVYKSSGKPEDTAHDERLNQFINSHNKMMDAKAKNDKSAARVHYLARNHHFAKYSQTAPHAHLKRLNTDRIQQIMSIKDQ